MKTSEQHYPCASSHYPRASSSFPRKRESIFDRLATYHLPSLALAWIPDNFLHPVKNFWDDVREVTAS